MRLDIYVNYRGTCEEAFRFYQAHLGGRLVIGELFGDPHWVSPARLRQRAEAAGLAFNRRSGTPLGYFARLDRPEEPQP